MFQTRDLRGIVAESEKIPSPCPLCKQLVLTAYSNEHRYRSPWRGLADHLTAEHNTTVPVWWLAQWHSERVLTVKVVEHATKAAYEGTS